MEITQVIGGRTVVSNVAITNKHTTFFVPVTNTSKGTHEWKAVDGFNVSLQDFSQYRFCLHRNTLKEQLWTLTFLPLGLACGHGKTKQSAIENGLHSLLTRKEEIEQAIKRREQELIEKGLLPKKGRKIQ